MSEELKACPFCGGEAEIERVGNRRVSTVYQCTNCGCSLETGEEWGHGKGWNTRTPAPDEEVVEDAIIAVLHELERQAVSIADPPRGCIDAQHAVELRGIVNLEGVIRATLASIPPAKEIGG